MGTEILVTGAAGYIGSRLARMLAEQGRGVRAAVLRSTPFVAGEQIELDLTASEDVLAGHCEGVASIVHLAGLNEVVAANDPATALTDTAVATLRVAEAALAAGVARLVYMSTVHVYGKQITEGAVLTEELRPEPTSVYAIARLTCEHMLAGFAERGLEVVVLRLTNSVGAPVDPAVDRWTLLVNDLCRQGAVQGRLELRSAGVQWRDFIPLADVCRIVGEAARSDGAASLPPGTYNLGSGSAATIRDVAGLVQDAFEAHTGERPPLTAPAPPPAAPGPYRVSVERLANYDLRASSTLESAVDETVQFCLEHRDQL